MLSKAIMDFLFEGFMKGKRKQPTREVKMCVLGLDNSGKTTILKALSHEEIHNIMPT